MTLKINRRIEIVRSSVMSLSSMSQVSCDAILAVLRQHYVSVEVRVVNTAADLEALAGSQPDLVFLGMKCVPTAQGGLWLADYLDEHEIAYTGSNQMAHELELDKALAKQCAVDHGLETSKFYVARRGQEQSRDNMPLTFPLFVKPTNRGGGLGIDSNSVAHNFDQLEAKVLSIASEHQADSMIETYLSGREFSVAILKDTQSAQFSVMPLELIAPADERGSRLLSAKVKSADSESFIEITDKIVKTKICRLAIDVFHALGARDYGRIDIRMDSHGTPHFLEANLLPSLIKDYGNFPKACMLNIGLDHEAMLLKIVELGLARSTNTLDTITMLEIPALPFLNPVLELAA